MRGVMGCYEHGGCCEGTLRQGVVLCYESSLNYPTQGLGLIGFQL